MAIADDAPVGKREANRRATRDALRVAAKRLFVEKGFAATTTREIAEAAGVDQRTFFRYFAVKEELLVDDILAWVPQLRAAVLARPSSETPLRAVREALHDLRAADSKAARSRASWLFQAGPPAERLGAASSGTLQRTFEADLIEVMYERISVSPRDGGPDQASPGSRLEAEVLGRTVVAVLRSALIHDSEQRRSEVAHQIPIAALIDQAFDFVIPA